MRLVLHGKSHFDAIVSLLSSTTKSWHFHEDGSFYIVQNDKNQGKFEVGTVFENHRKSLIQHCERSELRLHFEWTKVNAKNGQFWRVLKT